MERGKNEHGVIETVKCVMGRSRKKPPLFKFKGRNDFPAAAGDNLTAEDIRAAFPNSGIFFERHGGIHAY